MYKFNETSEGSDDFKVRRMHWRLSENNILIKEQDPRQATSANFVYQRFAASPRIKKKICRSASARGWVRSPRISDTDARRLLAATNKCVTVYSLLFSQRSFSLSLSLGVTIYQRQHKLTAALKNFLLTHCSFFSQILDSRSHIYSHDSCNGCAPPILSSHKSRRQLFCSTTRLAFLNNAHNMPAIGS